LLTYLTFLKIDHNTSRKEVKFCCISDALKSNPEFLTDVTDIQVRLWLEQSTRKTADPRGICTTLLNGTLSSVLTHFEHLNKTIYGES